MILLGSRWCRSSSAASARRTTEETLRSLPRATSTSRSRCSRSTSELNAAAERAVAEAVRAAGADAVPHPNRHLPADAARLRGLSVVGVHGGIGGAIRSGPDHEVQRRHADA
jgi:hypothetical protein